MRKRYNYVDAVSRHTFQVKYNFRVRMLKSKLDLSHIIGLTTH